MPTYANAFTYQLTYLGPYPTIASLSLGTGRQFRLRAVRNVNDSSGTSPRTYSIFLPHNSLLIMHGGCQEKYKHCIPSQKTVDTFKPPLIAESHIERINITFRFYRPDFQPSRPSSLAVNSLHGAQGTPRCLCGIPTILRADQKGKASVGLKHEGRLAGPSTSYSPPETELQYFWQCQGSLQNEGKGCRFFRLLNMHGEGRGPCLGAGRAAELSRPSAPETTHPLH